MPGGVCAMALVVVPTGIVLAKMRSPRANAFSSKEAPRCTEAFDELHLGIKNLD
jgi:hypothetical protein